MGSDFYSLNSNRKSQKDLNRYLGSSPLEKSKTVGTSSSETDALKNSSINDSPLEGSIGGPGSPEASSFKAVGSNNLVNLFTGDFSYSIPLLDVGAIP